MTQTTAPTPAKRDDADPILEVAVRLLEDGGEEGLQLRTVAKQAHVSLSTVYKRFASRDDLLIAATERWMAERVYAGLPETDPAESLADRLTHWYGQLFAPWVQQPDMLRVFLRAALLPGGERLGRQGEQLAAPTAVRAFEGYEPALVEDVAMILTIVLDGLMSRFARGQIGIAEVTENLERAIHRLADGARPL